MHRTAMLWNSLKSGLTIIGSGGTGNPQVTDVTYDSRAVSAGSVFVAVPGLKIDGDRFISSAIEKGAAVIVSQNPQPSSSIPWVQVADSRTAVGTLALALWGQVMPSVQMVGITGTNGKTTTAMLFHSLFNQKYGIEKSWLFGTVNYICEGKKIEAPHTTPEATDILRFAGRASIKPSTIAMEVSSHSLQLNRITGITYDCAVFTNLTQDHLDFHKTMENYYQAKKRLFTDYLKPNGIAVINIDDEWGMKLHQEIKPRVRCITYGESKDADVRIAKWHCDWNGSELQVVYKGKSVQFPAKLTGGFNRYNISAMVAGAFGLSYTADQIQSGLDELGQVPGRIERVSLAASFNVVVDYAHTPDALEKILTTSRELTKGRLICVFGCGGDRDRTKRPRMASAVARLSDEAVVTSDNPRTEKPETIINEILTGMPLDFPHVVIPDRREAIRKALEMAAANDCVVIAGKGHEDYQEINGVKHHFDDRETTIEQYGKIVGEGMHG
jgi:UDP-N-acetylmuramoyl-L-alanyl-D-glutamate--2,6-diaminopimelate ligase